MKKPNLKSLLTFLIGWPLSFVAVFFIIRSFAPDLDKITSQLQHVSYPLLVCSAICFFLYYLIRCIVWQRLLRLGGHTLSFPDTAFLWASSEIKRYIPGNIWSFLGRAVLFSRKGMTKKEVGSMLLIELGLILLAVFLVSLLSLPFLQDFVFEELPIEKSSLPYVGLFAVGLITLYAYAGRIQQRFHRLAKFLAPFLPAASVTERFILLMLSIASFICFGLGYFFSVTAIAPLDPARLLEYVGFFAFALIVGLFSFITPTGLGVREGVITLGLASSLSVSLAGFASLFSRLMLVASELFFLILMYLWQRFRTGPIQRAEALLSRYQHELLVGVLVTVFTVYFTYVSFLRYVHFYTGRFDLGNMTQVVWNTLHGNFFMISDAITGQPISRLAYHADFFLVFFTPLYAVWQDPRVLLFVQVLVTGLGAFFVYALSRDLLKQKSLAVLFSFLYLMNPSVQRVIIYDFHSVALATTFLLGAVYFLLKNRAGLFVLCAVLAGLTKEQVWFVVGLLGLFYMVMHKNKTVGLSVFAAGMGLFYLIIWQFIPQAAGTGHFALSYFSEDADSPSKLIRDVVSRPLETLKLVFSKSRVDYYTKLFAPLGFLPFLAPLFLIFAGPDLFINVMSQKGELHQIYYQYTAVMTPFFFLAAIYAIKKIKRWFPYISHTAIGVYILVISLLGAYHFGPLPGAREANLDMFRSPLKNRAEIEQALSAIPATASVAATNNLGSHLSHREIIYTIPYGITTADYVVFLLQKRQTLPPRTEVEVMILQLRQNQNYELLREEEEFFLFKRHSLLVKD